MIILDRCICDLCECDMGQLLAGPVQAPGFLVDMRIAPHFSVCPDCLEAVSSEAGEAA